ncbi:MAG TPA: lasso RiPP family leader peptide-containing protein [Longimicrobiaceae bacterium]|nr:lasso RiPP family leader peptide-containing protein [Longimicrobiaceae bacterium]
MQEANTTGKLPYSAPQLVVYGGLVELTLRDGGTMGMNDGGAGPDKTGF